MHMKMKLSAWLLAATLVGAGSASAEVAETDSFKQFIHNLVKQQHFNEAELRNLFKAVQIQQPILDAMSKPAEGKPWFQYREIFMTEARIAGGVQFWKDNEAALKAVESQYGVPAEIIIAIIGVETKYGAHTGKYRVIDALATLGFAYPPRSEFFLKELEQFLVLAREEHMDPLQPMGSYAGAMGLPQFMPSSFRGYAKDFDLDGKRNIWTNSADAIASVANYFVRNQWQPGGAVAYPVTARGDAYRQALGKGVKPDTNVGELRRLGVDVPTQLAASETVKLLAYQQQVGEDLWVGLHNFYVITRYNHSPLYAMAVYQLSQAIAARKAS
ncbi:lytic murein transglycosylase B [Methylomonas methanica]|uniref:Lytic murein transglycosylase B n=2 Tax=Methylomonas methanica TaxID=421 RepID=A0A177MU78_METMH|nr:lytic murein transglycosylase B [Methylomonas methanica]OAI08429.1 lytic murein transglycosylase B [Methylomonas methanica]